MADRAQRDRARRRYGYRCGYCGVRERDAGATLTVDHHRPREHGGADEDENLVYCCPRCNEHKGSYWHESDPPHVRLLHPARDELAEHVRESESGDLVGKTPEGVFFVERLRLNRAPLVAYRLSERAERRLRVELKAAQDRVERLQQRIAELNAALDSAADEVEREGA